MAEDVDDVAVRIGHKEATDAPWLVCKRTDDLQSALDSSGMHFVYIVDLDRDLRLNTTQFVSTEQRDLSRRIGRRYERDHPAHVHADRKAKEAGIEISTFVDAIGRNIWNDSVDAHGLLF
jgi:hypothetical protein